MQIQLPDIILGITLGNRFAFLVWIANILTLPAQSTQEMLFACFANMNAKSDVWYRSQHSEA